MPKPKKTPAELIPETRVHAIALMEDFMRLEQIAVASITSPVDLRHASAILRRWLIEGMLSRVAHPRIGKANVNAIDNRPVFKAVEGGKIKLFLSGGAIVHGVYLAAGMLNEGSSPHKGASKNTHTRALIG